ncbi:uncharacterized protein LOC142169589 [Nicotiana tabacum]|uniref:Uncharacterized protein LOC142169589 n=1 Tax=Nicotiana tabacum TaxID=4097 RepID=A0AC58SRH0_TOBAC
MDEDSELWDVIYDGTFIPMKTIGELVVTVPKTRKEYNDVDRKAVEKNFQGKKILVCGIGPDEYNRISACQSAKEIWEALQTAHEGITQVKQSKIGMLTTEYELFRMKGDESIQDMHTRFTYIINEIHSLGKIIPRNKLVRKMLSVLHGSWESKVNAITEKDQYKHNTDKINKRNPVPDRRFKRKDATDNVVKQALAAWGDSSSESGKDDEQGDTSMMAVESKTAQYNSIFALIAQNLTMMKMVMMMMMMMIRSSERKQAKDGIWIVAALSIRLVALMIFFHSKPARRDLLSVSQICDKGNKVEFLSKTCTIRNLVTGEVVLLAKRFKNIYVADFESLHSEDLTCLSAVDDDAELWHIRLVHASFSLLDKLVKKDLVRGLPKSRFKDHKVCDACARGKQFRTKDETSPVFVTFVKQIQVKISHNIMSIRSDHDTKFDNAKFDEFCVENSVVERKNRTLEDMARTMLIDSGIEKGFWAEVVNTAIYLVNMCMIRSLLNKTPYELLNRSKPKITHLRTFGCKCFVLNNSKEALGKFDAKSDEGIFLGYFSQSKACKVYNKRTQCVEESIYVIFDESYHLCGKYSHDKIDQYGEQSKVPGEVIDMENWKADLMSQVKESNEENTTEPPADIKEPVPPLQQLKKKTELLMPCKEPLILSREVVLTPP